MAKLELSEETKAGIEEVGAADLLIAVAAPVDAAQLRAAATQAMQSLGLSGASSSFSALRSVVAFPGVSGVEAAPEAEIELDQAATGSAFRFLPYALPSATQAAVIPWLPNAS